MTPSDIVSPSWSTSSFGDAADTSPMELSALGEHMDLCNGLRGRLFKLRCAADALQRAMAARFVTSFVLLALLVAVASLVV